MKTKEFQERVISMSERLYPMVSRMLGNTANAEDAIQEIMIKLWERRGQIKNHPNLSAFIFLTARNYCLDLIKKKKPPEDQYDAKTQLLASEPEHDTYEWQELKRNIEVILEGLPEQQKEVMIMRDLDGMEFIEIAELTKLRVDHIRVLLSRARQQVAIGLQKTYSYGKGDI
ncbi:RNA polymerase sigma factor [Cyclobacterium amurskyense]|mgnify:FL=1|uniref:RNA polymerase, sigma-24 subunit, ECF subfamily n=1 Tax=Cyclobacterium amurskyense TaxID=320787 RepID=A0A0H4Q0L8_9BACT|nr:sigma-70 family RNA polymerase sigma factor [Cyclobacterium amurskyense]AKP54177.1 RNA polymerase, sigma-24 subunit, ECF subfamily [Cyclobacterium amurskyense]|tara:strand:- start:1050 stop:1565 length:516 start_codon:yes stop_codon:yes gene_type:complete